MYRLFFLFFVSLLYLEGSLYSSAFCALRDPVTSLYELYPQANSYRSLVKTIRKDTGTLLSEQYGLTLYPREQGEHTAYLALEGANPVGVVFVHSEESGWGVIEMAWALSLDGKKIENFTFQRCRDPEHDSLLNSGFLGMIQGKTIEDLEKMLQEEKRFANLEELKIPEESSSLAASIIRSAMKTLIIAREVYLDDWKLQSQK